MSAQIEESSRPFTLAARYLLRRPDPVAEAAPLPLLVALHGQGMTADLMLRLLGLDDRDARLVLVPEGPYPFEKRRADRIDIGHAWYLYQGDQADFRRQLERSEAHLLGVIDEVSREYGVNLARTVLLGYSQGGYLAGFVALRHRARFRGLVLASTRFKHEFLEDEMRAGNLPAVLAVHSLADPGIAWDRARASLDHLERAGATVDVHLHDEGHRLPRDLGQVLRAWAERRGIA